MAELTCVSETLYAAFKPAQEGQKHGMYQWSLPEGNARHVLDSLAHTCMAEKCGKHFGLLGELVERTLYAQEFKAQSCRTKAILRWLRGRLLRVSGAGALTLVHRTVLCSVDMAEHAGPTQYTWR